MEIAKNDDGQLDQAFQVDPGDWEFIFDTCEGYLEIAPTGIQIFPWPPELIHLIFSF